MVLRRKGRRLRRKGGGKNIRRRGRKSNGKGRRQMVAVDTQAIRQLQVYRYPFSVATSQPKIPDGKVTHSIGLKFQITETYQGASAVAGGGAGGAAAAPAINSFIIVLYPSLGSFFHIAKTPDNLNALRDAVSLYRTEWVTWSRADTVIGPAGGVYFTFNDLVAKWRLVSKALKLKCICSDDHNDGYFEAVRLPCNAVTRQVVPYLPAVPGDLADQNFYDVPDPVYVRALYDKTNWLSNPSYVSGKLKNLSQYEFRLTPQIEEHDFINVPTTVERKNNEFNANLDVLDGRDNSLEKKFHIDDQFDCIAIKIQGVDQTKFLAHCVDNIEFIPKQESSKIHFCTESVDAGMSLKARQSEMRKEERLAAKFVGGPRNT